MKRIMMVVMVLGALMVGALACMAQPKNEVKILGGENEKPVTMAREMPEEYDIAIDGELLFRIRTSAAGFTAAERMRIIHARLVHIISFGPIAPETVHIVSVRGKPTIYVGNVRLVTVYPSDVEATDAASMKQLATWWAASVASSLHRVAPRPVVAEAEM